LTISEFRDIVSRVRCRGWASGVGARNH
jgi:hypothetical protein